MAALEQTPEGADCTGLYRRCGFDLGVGGEFYGKRSVMI